MALEPKDFTTRSVGAHSASQLLSLSRNSMDQIQHRYVEVNGLKLHVAETGTGLAAVMFLHGFPEIWYSWCHQMIVVANAGYKAIAPDYRGYRLSDLPPEPENASLIDSVHDMVTLLDALDIPKSAS
ncbi:hypothetical protein RHGRI_004619 [Rhododendron griersonianum]|uniref:AB hydrolase-1 domain-containing protein n=1 Tax=Rhododendron griersonianum TaxID=479676 RepID=A0AAV6L9M1_9ERIC|nr:hypothetical protein RHGRI_004619 [Rhododendron griersonianum]